MPAGLRSALLEPAGPAEAFQSTRMLSGHSLLRSCRSWSAVVPVQVLQSPQTRPGARCALCLATLVWRLAAVGTS